MLPQAAAPPNDPLDCDGIRAWRAESAMMAQTRDKRRLDEQMWYINHLPPHLREQMLQALRTENQPPPMGIVLPPSREGVFRRLIHKLTGSEKPSPVLLPLNNP